MRLNTSNWHFVNIPLARDTYDPAVDCKPDAVNGDCAIAELERLKTELRCASGEAKAEALKFAVHFIGDIHQPLHTVLEKRGGNDVYLGVYMRGQVCTGNCTPDHEMTKFHTMWDSGLILKTVWDWVAYDERLEAG